MFGLKGVGLRMLSCWLRGHWLGFWGAVDWELSSLYRYFKHLRIKFLYKSDKSESSKQSSSAPPSRRAMDPCSHPVFGNRPSGTICEQCGSIVDLRAAPDAQGIPMSFPYPPVQPSLPPPPPPPPPGLPPSSGQALSHILPNVCQVSPRSALGQMPRNATHFGEKVRHMVSNYSCEI